jgi:hypothetical protein
VADDTRSSTVVPAARAHRPAIDARVETDPAKALATYPDVIEDINRRRREEGLPISGIDPEKAREAVDALLALEPRTPKQGNGSAQ